MSERHDLLFALHQKLSEGDRTASEEIARRCLPIVHRRTSQSYPGIDEQVIADGVVDAVLEYCERADTVSVETGDQLLSLLRTAAWRNVANSVRSEQRRAAREARYAAEQGDVEETTPAGILEQKERDAELKRKVEQLLELLPNESDRQMLQLRLTGERRTEAFARILRIEHLPIEEQRRIVKRAKDRISKVIERAKRSNNE